jgi:hypothetical protein
MNQSNNIAHMHHMQLNPSRLAVHCGLYLQLLKLLVRAWSVQHPQAWQREAIRFRPISLIYVQDWVEI